MAQPRNIRAGEGGLAGKAEERSEADRGNKLFYCNPSKIKIDDANGENLPDGVRKKIDHADLNKAQGETASEQSSPIERH